MKLLVVQICLFLTLSAIAQADFREDSNGKLSPLWEPVIGEWELQEGSYNGKPVGNLPGFSLLPFEVADGMEIEVRAMDTGKGVYQNALIVFSYVDESEVYLAGSAIKRGLWYIIRTTHGGWPDRAGWRDLAIFGEPVRSNRWYLMSVEIDGATVRLSVDGQLKVEYTFKPELPKGRIGLGVSGANALFDEIRVTGVDASPVTPKDFLATTWAKLKS